MKIFLQIAMAIILLFTSQAGCSKKKVHSQVSAPVSTIKHETDVHVPSDSPKEEIITSALSTTDAESLDTPQTLNSDADSVLEGRSSAPLLPIYFDFDKANIRTFTLISIKQILGLIKGKSWRKTVFICSSTQVYDFGLKETVMNQAPMNTILF
jgi:hypothetical protein